MVSLVNIEPWVPLIGRLFVAFGTIESAMHKCVASWSSELVQRHTERMPLSRRIDFVLDLLALQPFSAEGKLALAQDLGHTKHLIKIRNAIAHDPLALVLFREEPGSPFREAIAPNAERGRYVEFAELEHAVARIERIAGRLHKHLAGFRLESFDLEAVLRHGAASVGSA